jgi:hypothetical protein
MNDTFYYACADCEPFKYEDAPMLWEIAKTEGWPGLVKWASEQRAARGEDHEPLARVKESMEVSRDNLAEANARTAKAEEIIEETWKVAVDEGHLICADTYNMEHKRERTLPELVRWAIQSESSHAAHTAEQALENERMQRTLLKGREVVALRDQAFEEAARVAEKSIAFGGSLIAFELRAMKKGYK